MPTLTDHLRERMLPPLTGLARWWLSELRAMVPASLSLPLVRASATAEVRPSRTGVEIIRVARGTGERFVEEKPLADFDATNWAETGGLLNGHQTRVLLRAPLIHVLTLRLPKVARRHLRSAIPLQLRDHAPLLPELLSWSIVDQTIEGDKLIVRIVIVRTSTLDEIEQGFVDHELAMPPVLADIDDTKPILLRRGRRQHGTVRLPRPWVIAVALLLSTPIWMLLVRHILILHEQDRVTAVEALAEPRIAAERRLRHKAELGHALKQVLSMPSATAVIEALATSVPSTAHAIQVEGRDGGTLGFTLETTDPDALRGEMKPGALLPGLRELDQSASPTGSMRIRYEAAPQ